MAANRFESVIMELHALVELMDASSRSTLFLFLSKNQTAKARYERSPTHYLFILVIKCLLEKR